VEEIPVFEITGKNYFEDAPLVFERKERKESNEIDIDDMSTLHSKLQNEN